jgi:hypothetical protein
MASPNPRQERDRMNYRRIATFTGWLWIITFVTSIPARLFFYAPVLDHEGNYVTDAGSDARTLIASAGSCGSVTSSSSNVSRRNCCPIHGEFSSSA